MLKNDALAKTKLVYFIVFLSLAFWAVFAFFTMHQLISSQEIYAKIINISGKQRMLSQKTTLMAKRTFETNNQDFLNHTLELIKGMKEDHDFIINNLTSQKMIKIYFDKPYLLDKKVKEYFFIFDSFLKERTKSNLQKVEEYSYQLLPELNTAVYKFEEESNQKTIELKKRQLIILFGTLLTLFLEAFLIVIPSIRINEQKEKELQEINNNLENRVKDVIKNLREKDKIINEQSKMIFMREILNNISHQWRQPLSIITTAVTGIKLKKEYKQLDEKDLDDYLNVVLENSSYLSKTIDNFRSFFENKDEMTTYKFSSLIDKIEELLKEELEENKISFVLDIQELNYYGNETRLLNSILHILNNAIDVLKNKEDQRIIFISIYKNENFHIKIKDNGGGIQEEIIDRIFEPYFTTKHKSLGKGMDLYIVKESIEKILKGYIKVTNEHYTYKGKDQVGALFEIILPSNQ
jgi:signal transduction histidine kinase